MSEQMKSKGTGQAFLLGVGVLVLVVLIGGVFFVRNGVKELSTSDTIVSASRVLGMPVARINGEKVLYADYVSDMATLERFYASEPTLEVPSPEQVSDQVLARLVANVLISEIAEEMDVEVTEEDIESAQTELLAQFDDEEMLSEEIMKSYGWSVDTYLERVVEPVLLEQKLSEVYVAANSDTEGVLALANSVLERILGGEAFEPLAAEFGSDGTAVQGGDLGYFPRGAMVPAFEEAAFSLEPGTVSPTLVETQFGYHIIKTEDKRMTTNDAGEEVEEVQARHILFQTGGESDFIAFMDEQFSLAEIEVLLDINNPFAALGGGTAVPAPEEVVEHDGGEM